MIEITRDVDLNTCLIPEDADLSNDADSHVEQASKTR